MQNMLLGITTFVVCVVCTFPSCADKQSAAAINLVTTSLTVDGRHIEFYTTNHRGEIQVVVDGEKETFLFNLPSDPGKITELRASSWLLDSSWSSYSGAALAVETTSPRTGADQARRSYYWVTIKRDFEEPHKLRLKAISKFLSDSDDFDIAGVVNPSGDSIYIILSQIPRVSKEGIAGYRFVHHCPIMPIGGALYELRATLKSD